MNELKDQIRNLLVENGCRLDNNLATSRTVDLLAIYTTRKELEARIDGMESAKSRVLRRTEIPRDAKNPTRDWIVILGEEIAGFIDDDITQLSTELTNKEMK